MASDVGVRLGVDGEKAFKDSLKAVNSQIKALGAEMTSVTASFLDNASSQQALAAKNTVLNKSIEMTKSKIGVLNKEIARQKEYLDALGEALDKASAEFGENSEQALKAQNAYNQQAKRVSDLTADLHKTETQLSGLNQAMAENNRAMEGSADAMGSFGEEVHDSADGVTQLANALAATGIAKGVKEIADTLYDCVNAFASFDAQMSAVQAISGATGEDMARLSEKAKEMGATTSFTAKQAGEAFEYMAMAGWKTEDMLSGIEGILHLAAASGESLASTSDIVTDALTAFGLSASDSARFADVLAVASSNANTNVGMMGETFKYVAPVAGALGYSIEDTAVAVGLLANAGIKSTQAGSTLRAVLTNLAKPSKEVSVYMEKLGVSLTDNKGKMRSLSSLLLQLRERFSGLAEAERAEYAAGLAGKEAMSGLLAIVEASEEDFRKLTDAINDSAGAAYEMSQIRLDNYAGQVTLLNSAVDGLKLTIGSQLSPVLEKLASGATTVVGGLNELLEKCPALTAVLVGLTSAAGLLAAAFAGFSIIKAVTPALVAFNAALAANPAVAFAVAIGGVVAAIGTLAAYCNDAESGVSGLNRELREIEGSYQKTSRETMATAAAADSLIDRLSELEAQETRTEGEAALYARTVAELGALMPDLNLELDEQTGLLIGGAEALRINTQAWKENALAQALQEKYRNVIDAQADALVVAAEKQLDYKNALAESTEIERQMTEVSEELARLNADEAIGYEEKSARVEALTGRLDALNVQYMDAAHSLEVHKNSLETAQEKASEFDQELERLTKTEKALADAQAEGADSAELMIAHVEGLVSELENLGAAYDESYNAAMDSIGEQLGLFNELDGSAKTSIDNLIATLEGQVEYMQTYADNIQRAMELGVNERLIRQLSDGSEKSAQILAAIVEGGEDDIAALNEQFAKVEEGQKDFSSAIVEMEKDFSNRVTQMVTDLNGAMQEMDVYDETIIIGENNIRGLIEGTASQKRALIDEYVGMANASLAAYKNAVGQHSPSKEFRKAGRYDIQGLIGGAESEGGNLESAYIELAETATLGVAEGIAGSSDKAVKTADKMAKDVYSRSKEWADRQVKYMDLSLKEQIALWEAIQGQFIQDSEQYADAEEKLYDLRSKQQEEHYDELKDAADRLTKYQKLSLREQLETWRNIQNQLVKDSKQYLQAEEKVMELRLNLQDEYLDKVEDTNKKVSDLENKYFDELAKRQEAIANSYGLFDKVAEREEVSGKDLLGNLRDQVSVMKSFYKGVEELADRGLSETIVDEIRAMGPAAEDELQGLLGLTDRELSEYANVYMEKQQLANQAALRELEDFKRETVDQIAENLQALKTYYDQNAPELGLSFTDGLVSGMLRGIADVRRAASSVAEAAVQSAGSRMSLGAPGTAYADIADTMVQSGAHGGGRAQEALEGAAKALREASASGGKGISERELANAMAGAMDGMDVKLDGQKVGRITRTRQEYDDRAFDR